MEDHNLVGEGYNQRSDCMPAVPRSVASVVKINSISIDLTSAMEKILETEKCQHTFSIRGYVADMRNSDVKKCALFPFDGDEDKLRESLPPLEVPKFRWWRCQNCVHEVGAAAAASASENLPNSQEARPPNLTRDEINRPLDHHEKEMNMPIAHMAFNGHDNGLRDDVSKQSGLPFVIHESCISGTAAMESNVNELVTISEPNPQIDVAPNSVSALEYPGRQCGSSPEIRLGGNGNSLDEEQRNAPIGKPSLEQEESDNDSFEGRRPQKVRLLTELLGGNGNKNRNGENNELASSSAERKRKMPEEASREVGYPSSEDKRVRARDTETTMAAIEISDTDSEEYASAGVGFGSFMTLHHTGKSSSSLTIKNKMNQNEDGEASDIHQMGIFGESSRDSIGLDLSLRMVEDVPSDHSERISGRTEMQIQKNDIFQHERMDISPSIGKKKAIEPEGHSGARSNTDDIPMDIVELMAKNQYERSLSESERNSGPPIRIDDQRSYGMIGFSQVHGNRVTNSLQKDQNTLNALNFSNPNNQVNFGQQNISFGATPSGSMIFGNSDALYRLWNGDNVRGFDVYNNTSRGEPQQIGRPGNIWASVPRPNILKKLPSQTGNKEIRAQQPHLHKEKRVKEFDLNHPNAEDLETSPENPIGTKDATMELNLKETGPSDSFSNETIPAMHLLSLMNPRMHSRATPFNDKAKQVFQKPFVPCGNHPTFAMDGRPNFLENPLFARNHKLELSGLGPMMYKPGCSTGHMPAAYYGQEFVRSREADKSTGFYSPSQNMDCRSRKPVVPSGVSGTSRDSNPRQDKQKGILGASDTGVVFPWEQQPRTHQNSSNQLELGGCQMHGIIGPLESQPGTKFCSFNRNPADFSIPDPDNPYMIRVEDLKFPKKDGRKKQRVPKFTTPKQ